MPSRDQWKPSMSSKHVLILFACWLLPGLGCEGPPAAPSAAHAPTNSPSSTSATWAPERIESARLPNAIRLHERVISGGQPAGEAAFEELAALGVKTVISVDGAKPEVELARRHGLRYVHMPHGYGGVPEDRGRELAKAVRDLPGPIYIHCHHGKHRSPAAATVACVGAGLLGEDQALAVLRTAGTGANYRGLFDSAESARRLDAALLDALEVEYPETVDLPPMAESMVAIEHLHDHLRLIEAAGWKTLADHPDLDPPHEALLLREQFTELLRTEETTKQPERFQELLRESEAAAGELETALGGAAGASDVSGESATVAFARVAQNCKACHQEFRDVPLSEKQHK
jgi:protein tyrosine phosphatase (PTP) superfamily phosphohydrolase (DUF442 family)